MKGNVQPRGRKLDRNVYILSATIYTMDYQILKSEKKMSTKPQEKTSIVKGATKGKIELSGGGASNPGLWVAARAESPGHGWQ